MNTDEWEDMDLAPRDGTSIIITSAGEGEMLSYSNTYIAAFWEGEEGKFSDEKNGAWICYLGMIEEPEAPIQPIRWRPLPKS